MTLFRFISRPGGPVDATRDLSLAQPEIQVGRGADSPLRLLRDGVRYRHARLTITADKVVASALPGAEIFRDGLAAPEITLRAPGDWLCIGPYRLTLAPADPALAAGPIITVTLDETGAFDEGAQTARYQSLFAVSLPNIRLWSFSIAVALVIGCLLLPLGLAPPAAVTLDAAAKPMPVTFPWVVGTMSQGHAAFGSNCGSCHQQAFASVANTTCIGCHQGIGQHADPHLMPAADLTTRRCANCHQQHKGTLAAQGGDQASCVACHQDLARSAPGTQLKNIHDFSHDHPQFTPALVIDAEHRRTRPVSLDDRGAENHSNLRFTHATHLKLDALRQARGGDGATCQTCHLATPGGMTFRTVGFADNCAQCHKLQFEPNHPEWQLPHGGNAGDVASRISGLYAQAALAGESFAAPRPDLFARPGAPLPAPAPVGAALVSYQTAAAMMSSVARAACGQCHVVTPPAAGAAPSDWTVEPVFVPERYLTKAMFRHDRHATQPCQSCHAAETSNGGTLTLLPGIDNCRGCHADPATSSQKVSSPCISCHSLHSPVWPIRTVPAPTRAAMAVPASTREVTE